MIRLRNLFNFSNLNSIKYCSTQIKTEIEDFIEIEKNIFENNTKSVKNLNKDEILKEFVQRKPARNRKPNRSKLNLKNIEKYKENSANVSIYDTIKENNLIDDTRVFKAQKKIENLSAEENQHEESNKIYDSELNLKYTKLKRQDPLLSTLFLSVTSKKRRKQKEQMLIEGRRLIVDALQSGLELEHLIFSQIEQLDLIKNYLKDTKGTLIKVPYSDLKLWSGVTTCPGIMGIFTKDFEKFNTAEEYQKLPITVICDNIREPNNLGSIIRSCAALPCATIITVKGCTDPWDSKCIRGGSGGHFKIPIYSSVDWSNVEELLPKQFSLFVAENKIGPLSMPYYVPSYENNEHTILIVGGETHGISEDAYKFYEHFKGKCLNIPLANGVDSLNSASAISVILFEMKRKIFGNYK